MVITFIKYNFFLLLYKMSQYSCIGESNYYLSNSIVTPRYQNIKQSYNVPQRFQNPSESRTAGVPVATRRPKVFKAVNPDRSVRQELNIAEGSQGLKFARIANAIDQIQSDLRCPYTQYFNGEKCVDNEFVCPASQYYEPVANKCIDGEKPEIFNKVNYNLDFLMSSFKKIDDSVNSKFTAYTQNVGSVLLNLQNQINEIKSPQISSNDS
jgi:hypothetical protein